MKIKQIAGKIQWSISLLGVSALSLLNAPTAFADVPDPDGVYRYNGGPPTPDETVDWAKLFSKFIYFLGATLIIELPIFILFGFRTKKKLGLAIMANVISVSAYHTANALLNGTNVVVAEALIIIFECVFLVALLRKEMSVSKIIIATIVANAASIILGTILTNFVTFV